MLKSIKEKNREEFEEKFVLRPFEPDGDWSFDYKNLTPYNLKEFLSVAENRIIEGVVEIIEEMKDWRQCNSCFDNQHCKGKNKECECICIKDREERIKSRYIEKNEVLQNLKEKLEEEMK